MLVDTHVHLDHPEFDPDREGVLRRAFDAGVQSLVAVAAASLEKRSAQETLELAEKHAAVHAAIGVHPHDARAATEACLEDLEDRLRHPRVLFLGEIGLDYHYRNSPANLQRSAFQRQLRIARERNIPVILHCRDAWNDLFSILKKESRGGKWRGIVHAFSGTPEQALASRDLGLLVSFSGMVTFRSAAPLRQAAAGLRLDQILVESAAPHLAPVPYRGRRNEPAFVVKVAESLARAMDVTFEDVARNTTANFHRITGHPGPADGDVLVYTIRDRLYVNLTNRCTARCVFCRRESAPVASGYNLSLAVEPGVRAYLEAIGDPTRYREIIFCGFGEPTLRLDELIEIARHLKHRGIRTRLNTNGHGNLIHGRNIVPDIAPFLDEISISIDAADPQTYNRVVRPDFGQDSFAAVVDFVRECAGKIPSVCLTAVDLPGVDLEACRKLAAELNVDFRAREYQRMVGSTDFKKE